MVWPIRGSAGSVEPTTNIPRISLVSHYGGDVTLTTASSSAAVSNNKHKYKMLCGCTRRLRSKAHLLAAPPRVRHDSRYSSSVTLDASTPSAASHTTAPLPATPPPPSPRPSATADAESGSAEWLRTFTTHHIPVTLSQRLLLTSSTAVLGLLNTHRGDMVAALSELTVPTSLLHSLHTRLSSSEEGRAILRDKPRVTAASVAHIAHLPPDSLGGAYHRFLAFHHYSPASRAPPHFIANPGHAYLIQRYRETHDIWHVLTACNTTVEGELTQKVFEHQQLGLPSALINVLAGQLRMDGASRARLRRDGWEWGRRCGSRSEWLLGVYWERYWESGLEEMRQRLNVELAPVAVRDGWMAEES